MTETSHVQVEQPHLEPRRREDTSLDIWMRTHSDLVALVLVAVGFLLRMKSASGTFLNPDEALHFLIANRSSWALAYQASLTMAHPPLLIFLLYLWRDFGTSEFVLRLPSILAGTGFCWIFYKWLQRIFGPTTALVGLVFVALLPPLVILSAEVRQYEFLLLFLISSAYFLERSLAENSTGLMLLSSLCLYLGMLSHYSGLLFAATIGVYSFWRVLKSKSAGLWAGWAVGQLGALALAIFLYRTHISRIKGTAMAEQAFHSWLYKSYFHRGYGNHLAFVLARTFSVFQYIFGQLVIGDIAALLCFAGVVFLLRGKVSPRLNSAATTRQLAIYLILPFAINCIAALLGIYPYGGTRHSVFLVIFAVAGVALFVTNITDDRITRGATIAVLIVVFCFAFRSVRHPYIARADQSKTQMDQALAFVREQIPASDPLFVDYESGLMLGHYLCHQKPISYDQSIRGFLVFHCGGHRIVSTVPDLWALTPQGFLSEWNELIQNGDFKAGETIWVAQVGWIATLDDELSKEVPVFRDLKARAFGKNIKFFKIAPGQTVE